MSKSDRLMAALFFGSVVAAMLFCLIPACALVRVANEQQTVIVRDTVHVVVRDTLRLRRYEDE